MDSHVIRYGFWLLCDATIKASLILALGLGVAHALRRSSAALRHLIVNVALAAAIAMPMISAMVPGWSVSFLRVPYPVVSESPAVAAPNLIPADAGTPAPRPQPNPMLAASPRPRTKVDPRAWAGSRSQASPSATAISTAPAATVPADSPHLRIPWFVVALGLWVVGALLLVLRMVVSSNRLAYLIRSSDLLQEQPWLHLLRDAMQAMGIGRHVALLQSCELDVPVTCGIFYPALILPPDAQDWTVERRRIVLCHELAHIERHDALNQVAGDLARALYWFNPLLWYACAYLRAQRERACDDRVLALGAKASDYARDLLEIASAAAMTPNYAAALAMARRSQLEGRLLAVLNPKLNRRSVTRRTAAAVAISALAVVLPLAAMRPQAVAAPAGAVSPATPAIAAQAASTPAQAQSTAATPAVAAPHVGVGGGVGKGVGRGVSSGVGGGMAGGVSGGVNSASTTTVSSQETGTPPPPGFECLGEHSQRNFSTTSHDGHKTWVVNWSGEGCSLDMRAEGDLTFNSESTQLTGISSGGYLEINQRTGSNLRRLRVSPTAGGALEYKLWANGQEKPFDNEARAWLSSFLLTLERYTGYNAKARVAALLQKGGPDAVIAEFANLGGDYVRARYLMEMIESAQLSQQQLVRVIGLTRSMHSDYEQARVLMAVSGKYGLNDEAARSAFLSAADNLQSDYEHARVLMELLSHRGVSAQNAPLALQSAAKIKSDYERARVLMALSESDLISPSLQIAYLNALSSINSDYERSRVLLGLMGKQHLGDQGADIALKAVTGIKSDYERARVLIAMLTGHLIRPQLQAGLLEAASSINSDYERARTLKTAAQELSLDDNGVMRVLNAAGGIRSDNELATLLLVVAGKYPLRGDVRSNYLKIANQIQSEYERNRALAAVATKATM